MDQSNLFNQWFGNIISIGAIAGTFLGWLPGIAAAVALIWYLIEISESATVQRWMATRRIRKIAKLKARVLMLQAQSKASLPGPEEGGASLHD